MVLIKLFGLGLVVMIMWISVFRYSVLVSDVVKNLIGLVMLMKVFG